MKKIEIEIPDGKKAEWINGVLILVNEKSRDITERVKTLDDACKELGEEHPLVKEYRNLIYADLYNRKDAIAYLKLRIIITALNGTWNLTFKDDFRYYPWFYMYSKAEYKELDKGIKKKCLIVNPSNNDPDVIGGFMYGDTVDAKSTSDVYYGKWLALRTKDLAEYCGTQFINIWCDYLLG